MSFQKDRYGLPVLTRRAEQDNLEEQIKALKYLEKQPAFTAGRLAAGKDRRKSKFQFVSAIKKKWLKPLISLFRRKNVT